MSRRTFLKVMAQGGLALATGLDSLVRAEAERTLPEPTPEALPRWRGFNLLEKFMVGNQRPFREEDLAWIAELGFDFVRLPLDYRCWIDEGDWTRLRESSLREIDEAVRYGEKHGVHVQIN